MRKLGLAGALSCAVVALGVIVPGHAVRADEPATITASWKQMKATPAVLTSQGRRSVDAPDTPAHATRASEQRDDSVPGNIPWIMRGTLGMSDTRH